MLKNEFTGRTRHRVQKLGWIKSKYVLVLQYEVKGFAPEYNFGPSVDGHFRTWWVDAKPEWALK